jgi:hypothetical protein
MIYVPRKVKKRTHFLLAPPFIPSPATAKTARMAAIFHRFLGTSSLNVADRGLDFIGRVGFGFIPSPKNNGMEEFDQSSLHPLEQHHENMLLPTMIKLGPQTRQGTLPKS